LLDKRKKYTVEMHFGLNRTQQFEGVSTMKTRLDYREDFLCIVSELEVPDGRHSRSLVREWYPVRLADYAEVRTLLGRPVTCVSQQDGTYADEDGNGYQLADKGETKPIAVEQLPRGEKSELEGLLEASLQERPNADSKRVHGKFRNNGRKPKHALQVVSPTLESPGIKKPDAEASSTATNVEISRAPLQLNLRQKLAEVRRRIGYVQKRGHNELCNYSYVTAADIAGSVGEPALRARRGGDPETREHHLRIGGEQGRYDAHSAGGNGLHLRRRG
jgi:hypothetical protein